MLNARDFCVTLKPRIHDAIRCTTRKMSVYTMQPVVQPVVQRVASCIRSLTNRRIGLVAVVAIGVARGA